MQPKKVRRGLMFVGLAAVAFLAGCTRPTHDAATLAAIKTESQTLMQAHPNKMRAPIARADWPQVIASIRPTSVSIDPEGVDIMVKPYFDGGYGYYVLKQDQVLPEPRERYSKLDEGIYWYHPY